MMMLSVLCSLIMGLVVCRPVDVAVGASKKIDDELEREKRVQTNRIKILLLGSSDAGKSTIIKQMRLIHSYGFTDTELIDAAFRIRANMVEVFSLIARGIRSRGMEVEEGDKALVRVFREESEKITTMTEGDEIELLANFASSSCFLQYLEQFPSFVDLPDNFHYFHSELSRILKADYIPTLDDVMNMRVVSQGIHEVSFDLADDVSIRLIDVGGQRTDRRKWIHFFEGVSGVIFVSSLASYNQEMDEEVKMPILRLTDNPRRRESDALSVPRLQGLADNGKNRLLDSIDLFHSISKSPFLSSSSFLLFLNKIDLLEKKLLYSRFVDHFPSFVGANDVTSAADFVQLQFSKASLPEGRRLYIHRTQATSTESIKNVFAAACDVVLQSHHANQLS